MELKDKLDLLWKYLFLIVFTYAVFSITCKLSQCGTGYHGKAAAYGWEKGSKCDKTDVADKPCLKEKAGPGCDKKNAYHDNKPCPPDCQKPCCAGKTE